MVDIEGHKTRIIVTMTALAIILLLIVGVMLAGGFWEFVAIVIGLAFQLVYWAVYICLWLLVVLAVILMPLMAIQ